MLAIIAEVLDKDVAGAGFGGGALFAGGATALDVVLVETELMPIRRFLSHSMVQQYWRRNLPNFSELDESGDKLGEVSSAKEEPDLIVGDDETRPFAEEELDGEYGFVKTKVLDEEGA